MTTTPLKEFNTVENLACIGDLDSHVLERILNLVGAWQPASLGALGEQTKSSNKKGTWIAAWSVCKHWRDCLQSSPTLLADLLVKNDVRGLGDAVRRAIARRSSQAAVDQVALVTTLLTRHPGADLQSALVSAAEEGQEAVVRLLLGWPQHAPLADCQEGRALVGAAENGHEAVVRLLLDYPHHAPHADCQYGQAVISAAENGHAAIVKLLLEWSEHAPSAHCQDGEALVQAAFGGHEAIVRLLLEWPEHAPHADCQGGEAVVLAAMNGQEALVRLLLDWPQHAPHADCQSGEALVQAAHNGHVAIVRLLLGWPQYAPRADCQNGGALVKAACAGEITIVQLLLEWPHHAPSAPQIYRAVNECCNKDVTCYVNIDDDMTRLLLTYPMRRREEGREQHSLYGR